ncbi:MAG: response regulator [Flavobacteriaceae bacterium]|nr:response regulator [Flavobacteriaceae bacterium]OUX39363.1 MAG: response regulator [Flavobacteriaceae bacterium TMED265]
MKVLLIEDDKIEQMKLQRVTSKFDMNLEITTAENGEQALEILSTLEEVNLIVLDLNMPRMNGLEFLTELRKNEKWKYVPVIILTTSSHKEDIQRAYRLGISGYLVKPLRYEDYSNLVSTMFNYWTNCELFRF